MRIGIIDLGTNSVRFAIYEIKGQGGLRQSLYREKIMLRPGQAVFTTGLLTSGSATKILKAFRHFASVARKYKVWNLGAYATSALREAANSDRLVQKVARETGIEIKIISGQREAELIALGILQHEPSLSGRHLLVDIGGGSTELSFCLGRKALKSLSLDLGAQRLAQMFLKPEHMQPGVQRDRALKKMRRHIQKKLAPLKRDQKRFGPRRVVGSSGTLKALARILTPPLGPRSLKRPRFSQKQLSELVEELQLKPQSQYGQIRGLELKRRDLILPGAVLLEEILLQLKISKVETTEFSLREGLLIERINQELQS